MLAFVDRAGWLVWIGAAAVAYLLMSLASRPVRVHWLDMQGYMDINNSAAVALLAVFAWLGYVSGFEFARLLFLYAAFYVGLLAGGTFFWKGEARPDARKHLRALALGRSDMIGLTLVVAVLGSLNVFTALELARIGVRGDDRLLVASAYRPLEVVRTGLLWVVTYVGSFAVLRTWSRWAWALAAIVLATTFVTAGKNFALQFLVGALTVAAVGGWLGRGGARRRILIEGGGLGVALVGAVAVQWLFGHADGAVVAARAVLNRVVSSGDLYYYAFVAADYHRLFGQLGLVDTLLHPLPSTIHLTPYQPPLGVLLFGLATGTTSVYGPNAALPLLALVVARGNDVAAVAACAAAGLLVAGLRRLGLRALAWRIPAVLRLSCFVGLFALSPLLFLDIGIFKQAALGVVLAGAGLVGFSWAGRVLGPAFKVQEAS